ncbi:MAG TPA: L-lactate dehydrogenase [Gemmatimonadaceae bacterium]|nr:L-lactate dehydrogenase [Gemmatimonadaceae bacterium]
MKVGIVGAGHVGATAAYALALRGSATDVVLVDISPARAAAQAMDVAHAVPVAQPVRVTSGPMSALAGFDVVVLACGPSIEPGQTRMAILERSARIFGEVVPDVVRHAPGALLVVASNPVDVMTHVTAQIAGLPAERVIGTGTILDTLRFRAQLSAHLGIAATSIHADVLGEHGDSEVLAWSSARVGGMPLLAVAEQLSRPIASAVRARIDEDVRRAGYRILEGKGFTSFGIGAAIARVVDAVRDDERAVLTVSARTPKVAGLRDVALSLPRVVGRAGVLHTFEPDVDAAETEALAASAAVIREATTSIGF